MHRRDFLQSLVVVPASASISPVAMAAMRPAQAIRSDAVRMLITMPERDTASAVVLLPTIAGIDAYMAQVAGRLASDGHVVATWDPYNGRAVPTDTLGQLAMSKTIRDEDAVAGIRTVMDHVIKSMKPSAIATMGWCLGGRYALLHGGLDPRVAAVVSYNPTICSPAPVTVLGHLMSKAEFPGQTMDEFGIARRIACPVQVARPGHDLAQPEAYEKLQQALYSRSVATRIDYFPEATHGFAYQPRNDADHAAAAIAWAGTRALFDVTLAPGLTK